MAACANKQRRMIPIQSVSLCAFDAVSLLFLMFDSNSALCLWPGLCMYSSWFCIFLFFFVAFRVWPDTQFQSRMVNVCFQAWNLEMSGNLIIVTKGPIVVMVSRPARLAREKRVFYTLFFICVHSSVESLLLLLFLWFSSSFFIRKSFCHCVYKWLYGEPIVW